MTSCARKKIWKISSGVFVVINNYSTIFTEPEGNNCFSIISELNNREYGLKHKNKHAIVRLHTRM